MEQILITGAAGFIAAKTAELLLLEKRQVIGIDNLNDYYDARLKKYRLTRLKRIQGFTFKKMDIENLASLKSLFQKYRFNAVVNLAARAGVRSSMEDPFVYLKTNTLGVLNLLELCKHFKVKKFILASTASLYAYQPLPFKETLCTNTPISPYAATKKGAEALCYTYHYLYGIDVIILRYFTVYGPAGRPDMSIFRFIKCIDEGRPLNLFGDGSQSRDFTYVDDIARGTVKSLKSGGFRIINLGGNRPHQLHEVISLIEKFLGKKAKIRKLPFHKADMKATWADIRLARKHLGWQPEVGLEEGIKRTVHWYLENRQWLKKVVL